MVQRINDLVRDTDLKGITKEAKEFFDQYSVKSMAIAYYIAGKKGKTNGTEVSITKHKDVFKMVGTLSLNEYSWYHMKNLKFGFINNLWKQFFKKQEHYLRNTKSIFYENNTNIPEISNELTL